MSSYAVRLWSVVTVIWGILYGTAVAAPLPESQTGKWRLVREIPLPGAASRFDYMSLDPADNRLYLAHLGDGRLVVFDTKKMEVIANLGGFPHVHGVLVVPGLHRVYATVSTLSRRKAGRLVVLDSRTLHGVAKISVGIHPDGLDYESTTGRLFVSNEWGGSVSVVDALHERVIGTIPLGGEVGNTRVDPVAHRVWATVQTQNLLVGMDPKSLTVVRRIPLPCRHPHGLLIRGKRHLALVACERDASLLGVDLVTGRILFRSTTGKRPDVLSEDPSRHLLFVASESGVVDVFRLGDHLEKLSEKFLGVRAHSVLVDPRSSLLYFPFENRGDRPALRIYEWKKQGEKS